MTMYANGPFDCKELTSDDRLYLAKMAAIFQHATKLQLHKTILWGSREQINATINAGFGDVDNYASFDLHSYTGNLRNEVERLMDLGRANGRDLRRFPVLALFR
jgi:hypothetical protein